MRDEDPTPDEIELYALLSAQVSGVQDWYHRDTSGALWMVASFDVVVGGHVTRTWRCDYDGHRLLGGPSPSGLNSDDGVRAIAAGIDVDAPNGLSAAASTPREAADLAAAWFIERLATSEEAT